MMTSQAAIENNNPYIKPKFVFLFSITICTRYCGCVYIFSQNMQSLYLLISSIRLMYIQSDCECAIFERWIAKSLAISLATRYQVNT